MSIIYDNDKKIFHLNTEETSYVIKIINDKYLAHIYWGKRIKNYSKSREIVWKDRGFAPNPTLDDRTFSLDTLPQEYPQT